MLRLDVCAGVASVTIDNPPVNAWGEAELDDLARHIDAIRASEAVVAVIRGSGRHFSAGGDIKMMVDALEAGDMGRLSVFANRIQSLFLEWRGLEIPTVAVLRGAVVGGGLEMALASDLRIAAASAR
ncbi:MAG: enoyl-CoA hydratase/isomerase family protein, partial [Actinomycetota bacterium]|nr:enoyl-CoA hydratase/isomerase family protein [Actinomycetota bacterium]